MGWGRRVSMRVVHAGDAVMLCFCCHAVLCSSTITRLSLMCVVCTTACTVHHVHQSVRLYDIYANTCRSQYTHGNNIASSTTHAPPPPVLDCAFHGSSHTVSGALDGRVVWCDWASGVEREVGVHEDAVRCVRVVGGDAQYPGGGSGGSGASSAAGLIASGGWDKTLSLWDVRLAAGSPVARARLPGKVYSMDTRGNLIVVAMPDRAVWVWDVRKMTGGGGGAGQGAGEPLQKRQSALKFQTRCVRMMPGGEGMVVRRGRRHTCDALLLV